MIYWTVMFLLTALAAGLLSFLGATLAAAGIATILFVVLPALFVVIPALFLVPLITNALRRV